MPKRKELEALFFEDGDKFCSELIEKGGRLVAVIAPDYPDAERVREEIRNVLDTVETYEVVGKWVNLPQRRGVCDDSRDLQREYMFLFILNVMCYLL